MFTTYDAKEKSAKLWNGWMGFTARASLTGINFGGVEDVSGRHVVGFLLDGWCTVFRYRLFGDGVSSGFERE